MDFRKKTLKNETNEQKPNRDGAGGEIEMKRDNTTM